MNKLITLLLLVAFASCNVDRTLTRHERIAQRKLRKAIKHDPNIISKQYTDTLIQGIAKGIAQVRLEADSLRTAGFYCDSLNNALAQLQRDLINRGDSALAEMYLYRDSLASISVRKEKDGRLSIQYKIKDRIVPKEVAVPYQVQVRVPGKLVTQYRAYPCWHYFWFWCLLVLALLFIYLTFSSRARTTITNVLTREK